MDIRTHFPFTDTVVNCNNAGMCPPPIEAAREGAAYLEAYSRRGLSALLEEYPGRDASARKKLAALLGCRAEEIALTHNTAEGINTIARGFPFKAGDRVLTAGREYPANIYPWMNIEDHGVALDLVPEEADGSLPVEKITAAIRPETALVTISFVQWCTGYRVDLKALAAACHARGIPLVVDGAQGVGAVPLDVVEADIDALACPAWKWLWGPIGLGFLYMKPDFMEKIRPPFAGADGVREPAKLLEYNLEFAPDMRRFEYATKNYGDIIVFDRSLDLTLEIGIGTIWKQLIEIGGGIRKSMEELGFALHGEYPEEYRSGILSFNTGKHDADTLLTSMRGEGILANIRDGRLRLSPHVYFGEETVSLFAEKMGRLAV